MKTRLIRYGVILAIATLLLSSAVLVRPAQAQGNQPSNPGGVCAVVSTLPLPEAMIDALRALFGCGPSCPPDCDL